MSGVRQWDAILVLSLMILFSGLDDAGIISINIKITKASAIKHGATITQCWGRGREAGSPDPQLLLLRLCLVRCKGNR